MNDDAFHSLSHCCNALRKAAEREGRFPRFWRFGCKQRVQIQNSPMVIVMKPDDPWYGKGPEYERLPILWTQTPDELRLVSTARACMPL